MLHVLAARSTTDSTDASPAFQMLVLVAGLIVLVVAPVVLLLRAYYKARASEEKMVRSGPKILAATCPKCAYHVRPGAIFCENCGAQLREPSAESAAEPDIF